MKKTAKGSKNKRTRKFRQTRKQKGGNENENEKQKERDEIINNLIEKEIFNEDKHPPFKKASDDEKNDAYRTIIQFFLEKQIKNKIDLDPKNQFPELIWPSFWYKYFPNYSDFKKLVEKKKEENKDYMEVSHEIEVENPNNKNYLEVSSSNTPESGGQKRRTKRKKKTRRGKRTLRR